MTRIVAAVFEHDRADIFEGSFKSFAYYISGPDESERLLKFLDYAIDYGSTEIMRSIINNKENVQIMKDWIVEDGFPLAVFAPAACDVSMIKELIEYGIEFTAFSVVYALKRDSLETFEYLLYVVELHDREEIEQIICNALVHQKYNHAFQIFMTKGFFRIIDLREFLLGAIALADGLIIADRAPVELALFFLGHLRDDMEIDEVFFHFVVCVCIREAHGHLELHQFIHS